MNIMMNGVKKLVEEQTEALRTEVEDLLSQKKEKCMEIGMMLVSSEEICAEFMARCENPDEDVSATDSSEQTELAEKIRDVYNLENRMRELQQQIDEIERHPHCLSCGKNLDADALYCKYCGCFVGEEPATKKRKCAKCGYELPEEAVFCPNCGSMA